MIDPECLTPLASLSILSLDRNNDVDTFPNSIAFGEMIEQLSFANTKVTYLASDLLWRLAKIQNLNLKSTGLKTFPRLCPIGDTLKTLNLENNQIRQIDHRYLNCMVTLEILYLQSNQLADIPDVSGPATLWLLNLNDNLFANFPSLMNLGTSTKMLYMNGNPLSVIESEQLEPLIKLTYLTLLGTNIAVLPDVSPINGTL